MKRFLAALCAVAMMACASAASVSTQAVRPVPKKEEAKKPFGCHPSGPKDRCVRVLPVVEINDFVPLMVKDMLSRPADEYILAFNSPGGSHAAAMAVVKMLQESKKPVTCVAHRAYSAAFIILQACHKRVMDKESRLLIHEIFSMGPIRVTMHNDKIIMDGIKEQIGHLRKLNDEMAKMMSKRLKISEEAFKQMILNKNWEMGPEEALEYNAIDEIVETNSGYIMTVIEG